MKTSRFWYLSLGIINQNTVQFSALHPIFTLLKHIGKTKSLALDYFKRKKKSEFHLSKY